MSYIYYILYTSTFIILAARLTYFCVDLEMNSLIISFLIKNHVSGLQDKLLKPIIFYIYETGFFFFDSMHLKQMQKKLCEAEAIMRLQPYCIFLCY